MNEQERNAANYMTAVQGEMPVRVGDMLVREANLESLSVLQLVGSPFAAVVNGMLNGKAAAPEGEVSMVDIAIMVWTHGAEAEDVLQVALQCAPGYAAPAVEAALRFVRGRSTEEVKQAMEVLTRGMERIRAASFDAAAPEHGKGGKKKR